MVNPAGRTPFTEKDIANLTEYLATHSTDKGRMGNKLYQDLVANTKEWPWSQRHSWQSWRDHYKRNPDSYERRIRKYLREKDSLEDTSRPVQPAGSKRKASGSPEELHNAKRAKPAAAVSKPRAERSLFTDTEDEEGQGSQIASRGSGKEAAETAVAEAGQTRERSKPLSTTQGPPVTVSVKPKPRLIPRKVIDEDPFISTPPATPPLSPPPPTSTRREPPKYVEGPFRNTLSTGKSTWPPIRRKSQAKPNGFQAAQVKPAPPAPPPPVVANATPSSSKKQLPPGNYKSIDEVIKAPSSSQSRAMMKHTPASAQSAHSSAKKNPAPIRISPAKSTPQAKQPRKDTMEPSIPASRSFPQPHNARPHEPSLYHRASEGNVEVHSDDAVEDAVENIFTEMKMKPQPAKQKDNHDLRKQLHARRVTDTPTDAPIPHLDLTAASRRQSSTSSTSRKSSSRSSLAPSMSASRRDSLVLFGSRRSSINHAAALRDRERFEKFGRKGLLEQLARRYGFDPPVAETAYERLQDLNKTDVFLSKLRDEADVAGRALLSRMLEEDNTDDSHDRRETRKVSGGGGARDAATAKGKVLDDSETVSSISTLQHSDKYQRRRSNGPRHSLTIRPIPAEEVDKYVLTVEEYSPPRRSRAGRYSRKSGSLPKPHIMPYSQTPGGILGNREQGLSSPPRVDLRFSSSPLKGRKSVDQESLPPSSPPKGEGGGAEDGQDEDEEEDTEDSLEDEYEDLFGGGHRPTSPEEVEQELFSEQLLSEDEDDREERALENVDVDEDEDADTDENRYDDDDGGGYEETDEDEDEDPDVENAMGMDDNEADEDYEGEGHSNQPDDYAEDDPNPLKFFARLHPDDQEAQRHLAKLVNTTNLRKNRHAIEEWEATLDPEKKHAHEILLLQTVLDRLREGVEKPVRLDQAFDEALEEY